MRGAERVVFALGALGEAGQAAALAQRADAVAASGQNLVRIGLMADVPDQPVARRVEHVVQRDGELDHAEAGAEMAAGDGDRIDRFLAQFVGDLPQLELRSRRRRSSGVLIWSSNGVLDKTVTLRSLVFQTMCFFGLMPIDWGPDVRARSDGIRGYKRPLAGSLHYYGLGKQFDCHSLGRGPGYRLQGTLRVCNTLSPGSG